MHVMKCTALGAASGAVIGGIGAVSCMSLTVFVNVVAKSLVNSLSGRPLASCGSVSNVSVFNAVCIGIVLGGLIGLVTAVVTNYFSPPKNDSN
jgi:hypothetical protein